MTTPLLGMTELVEGQASADVAVNNAIRILESVHTLEDTGLDTPPGSPAEGDAHFIIATATGAWAGKEGQVALYSGGGWEYYTPFDGQLVLVKSVSSLYRFNSTPALVAVNFSGTVVDMGTGSGTQTIATASGSAFKLKANGNVTLAFSGTPDDMAQIRFRYEQTSGGHTLSMPASVRYGTKVGASDISGIDTSAGAVAYLMFQYHADDAKYDLIAFNDAFI